MAGAEFKKRLVAAICASCTEEGVTLENDEYGQGWDAGMINALKIIKGMPLTQPRSRPLKTIELPGGPIKLKGKSLNV